MRTLLLFSWMVVVCSMIGCTDHTTKITDLTVEMQDQPIGLDQQSPRFGWQIDARKPDIMQASYRIVVAPTQEDLRNMRNFIWDSGTVPSSQTQFIPYMGSAALQSGEDYFWKVCVTTNQGDSLWSEGSSWGMGLLSASDWQARWIGNDSLIGPNDRLTGNTRVSARYLRKEFPVKNRVTSARLYICGLGLYECYINGNKISKDQMSPTATDYTKSVCYNVYDVDEFLQDNQNAIGVILGNGRLVGMRFNPNEAGILSNFRHFGMPKLLAQLEITYKDGQKDVITTDDTWKITGSGPIISNSEFDGEEYDANLEMKGWDESGYNDSQWLGASYVSAPEGKLVSQTNPNIRIQEVIEPVAIHQLNDSTYILDMGQNMVGHLAVSLKGIKGHPIRMRFSETLKPDSTLYMANLRGALVTDVYIPSFDGMFSWEPLFTYHGFRFVELTGLDYKPELSSFRGKVKYDKMETTGSFECSDPTLNQIYRNAFWGIRGNYRSMPTDCPQRDERMGWLGDRATGCIGESFMFNQALLYEKWLRDIEQSQNPDGCVPDVAPAFWSFDQHSGNVTWPAAYICVADMLYRQYGDTRPIVEHYASMKRWIDFIRDKQMKDFIVTNDVYGDWCMPPESQELIHSADPARKTDGRLLATSFYYRMLNLMTEFADVLGKEDDKTDFQNMAALIKNFYNQAFLNPQTGQYVNNTVTANIISLMQGLVPDSLQQKVFNNVVDKTQGEFGSHVSTGLIGIQFLMRGLTDYGKGDLAYTIATNKTYPSWGYMADKGATTIWELWNGDTGDPEMNSGNHVMLLGDLITWYYEDLAGIKAKKPGFTEIEMSPYFPEGLDWVKASYKSIQGKIGSSWKRTNAGLQWDVEIPTNTTAVIRIPASSVEQITENGKSLTQNPLIKEVSSESDGFILVKVNSGKYCFFSGK